MSVDCTMNGATDESDHCKRDSMLTFWKQYSHSPTVESMMLNEDAKNFCEDDRRDILSTLPDLSDKRVLELGAGIGRFTGFLATNAKHVLATDFIESFILKNYEQHKHLKNVSFETADAANLELENECVDVVFTNWLLMYLTDDEVVRLLQTALNGLTPNGFMHVRESCTERSTRAPSNTAENPTYYRHASQYLEVLNAVRVVSPSDGNLYRFNLMWAKSVPTYIEMKNNWRQVHLMVQKVLVENNAQGGFRYPVSIPSKMDLLKILNDSAESQKRLEGILTTATKVFSGSRTPIDSFLIEKLLPLEAELNGRGMLNLGSSEAFCGLSAFKTANRFDCCVVDVETSYYAFCSLLTQCNTICDKRVRVQLAFLDQYRKEEYPDLPKGVFHVAFGVNVLSSSDDATAVLLNLKSVLDKNGQVVFVEQGEPGVKINAENIQKFEKLFLHAGFLKPTITEIGEHLRSAGNSVITAAGNGEGISEPERQIVAAWDKKLGADRFWNFIEAKLV